MKSRSAPDLFECTSMRAASISVWSAIETTSRTVQEHSRKSTSWRYATFPTFRRKSRKCSRAALNLQVVSGDTLRIAYLHLNGGERTPAPPMRDIRVRQAILHSINREAI